MAYAKGGKNQSSLRTNNVGRSVAQVIIMKYQSISFYQKWGSFSLDIVLKIATDFQNEGLVL